MKTLVINLKSAPERRKFQEFQLGKLNLKYEIMDAANKENADAQRSESYWKTWQRPLRKSEKACFLSHEACWQAVDSQDEPMLILEDDAILSDQTPDFLKNISDQLGYDIISLETRGRAKFLSKKPIASSSVLKKLYLNRDGAAAYILWPLAARKLLAMSEKSCAIADAFLWTAFDLRNFQTDPALAIQADRCAMYGIDEHLKTGTSIINAEAGFERKSAIFMDDLSYKFRRSAGQIKMLQVKLSCFLLSEKKSVDPIQADFNYLDNY